MTLGSTDRAEGAFYLHCDEKGHLKRTDLPETAFSVTNGMQLSPLGRLRMSS